jgi:alpha-beta hydrolase superfamily lysophospholipase
VRRQALQNRCATIINHVAKILEEYPDYRLFVTGHSLGGALATAFAFFAADSSDPRIPKPVTCISIASPKVGNLSFRLATEVRMSWDAFFQHNVATSNTALT